MNDPQKRAGRPSKVKVYHSAGPIPDSQRAMEAQLRAMDGLKLDPTHTEELAIIFDELLLGKASEKMKMFCGLMLAGMVEDAPSHVLKEFFGRISAMKKRLEEGPETGYGRMYHSLEAWRDYVAEMGAKPSKPQLKKFILERPKKYKGMPGIDDGKGWSELWKATSLQDMPPR